MTGWLPIELELDHCPFVTCPSITAAPTVRWMHFGDNSLSEPFFRQTVQRLRTGNRPALEIETTHYSVVREANRHSSLLPIGFICHISRCGSTLISNALKVLEGIQVVAEASPIYRLFLPSPRQVPRWPRSNEELRRFGESLFNLFAYYRTGVPEPIVVKFTSLNSLYLSTIRKLWPDIPCLFIIRNPVEVMVSNLLGHPVRSSANCLSSQCRVCWTDHTRSEIAIEECAAGMIGRYLDEAIGCLNHGIKIIDYEDIGPDSIGNILEFFGMRLEHDLDDIFRYYSKDSARQTRFYPDKAYKLREANSRILKAAERWALPQYRLLRSNTEYRL